MSELVIKEKSVNNKTYNKAYYEANKDKIKASQKAYREANKDKINARRKAYYEANKDKIKASQKAYREANKDKINKRRQDRLRNDDTYRNEIRKKERDKYNNNEEWRIKKNAKNKAYNEANKDKLKATRELYKPRRNKLKRERYNTDTAFRLIDNQRGRVRAALNAKNASKNSKTMEYICCSGVEFRDHIEKQFTSGMTWENHGNGIDDWDVDHRRPCNSFTFETEEEKYMCFHWTNCQPMWSSENSKKSDKFDLETFEYEWKGREIGWVRKGKKESPSI